jgi:hypothetical protein
MRPTSGDALTRTQLPLRRSSDGGARRRIPQSTRRVWSKGSWRWDVGRRVDCLVRLPNGCLARDLTTEIFAAQLIGTNLHSTLDIGRASEDPRLDIKGSNGASHLSSDDRRRNPRIYCKVPLANKNCAVHHYCFAQQNRLGSNYECRNPRFKKVLWLDENPVPWHVSDFDDNLIRR